DVDPTAHALEVDLRRLLDERVEPDRAIGEAPDVAQPFAQIVSVHVPHGDRLDDTDRPRGGNGCDELGIATRGHRPADERDLDADVRGEAGLQSQAVPTLAGSARAKTASSGLHRERATAAAAARGVRVAELEPRALQPLDVVDLRAHQVHEA